MSNQIEVTSKYIAGLKPSAIPTDKNIGDHIVKKFMAMYQVPKSEAVAFYEREKDNFMKRITDSDDLKSCTPMSIFFAFTQVFGWGLSFEAGEQADVYLILGNRNIGTKDNPNWIKECNAQPSPYGKKKIRIQNGQIKGTSEPKIVYDNDTYEERTDDNENIRVVYVKNGKGPRTDKSKIIGSFIKIILPDGTHETKTFDLDDISSWRAASERKNKGKGANPLYTSNNGQIDKHFFEGKTLTHAFKGYPKVINVPKLPETFVPDSGAALRQGLDVSEFTDSYEEVNDQALQNSPDEFDRALENEGHSDEPTMQFAEVDDDEPEF